jgi:hypothetical protein
MKAALFAVVPSFDCAYPIIKFCILDQVQDAGYLMRYNTHAFANLRSIAHTNTTEKQLLDAGSVGARLLSQGPPNFNRR